MAQVKTLWGTHISQFELPAAQYPGESREIGVAVGLYPQIQRAGIARRVIFYRRSSFCRSQEAFRRCTFQGIRGAAPRAEEETSHQQFAALASPVTRSN